MSIVSGRGRSRGRGRGRSKCKWIIARNRVWYMWLNTKIYRSNLCWRAYCMRSTMILGAIQNVVVTFQTLGCNLNTLRGIWRSFFPVPF